MAVQNSPITGVIQEADVILDFGKYEGCTIKEIQDKDPEYYQEMITQKDNGHYSIRRNKDKTFRLYLNPISHIEGNA